MKFNIRVLITRVSSLFCAQLGDDVKLFRDGAKALAVEGSVGILGELNAKAIKVNGVPLEDIIRKILKEALEKKQD